MMMHVTVSDRMSVDIPNTFLLNVTSVVCDAPKLGDISVEDWGFVCSYERSLRRIASQPRLFRLFLM